MGGFGMDSSGSGQREAVRSYEHGNKTEGSIQCKWNSWLLNWLNDLTKFPSQEGLYKPVTYFNLLHSLVLNKCKAL